MKLKQYVQQRENEISVVSDTRQKKGFVTRLSKIRCNADIDYARVLYSSSFRRLQGKMQLFVPKHTGFYRNRLTHSLEVAQIARAIAKKIGMVDTLTVQTCSLAHDLGNPPFGHAGEISLSNCSTSAHYEGNAQTFRILNHIEEKHHSFNGLNLTLRTLLGIVKYPNSRADNSKKYLYDNDYKLIQKWSAKHGLSLCSIDCEVMNLADEIAYAAHDLEDALRLKYFTIGDLLYEFEVSEFKSDYNAFANITRQARQFASKASTYETSEEYSILFKKELTSILVDTLINDIGLVKTDRKGQFMLGYNNFNNLALGLKKLTFAAVKRNSDVIEYEYLGKRILEGLYNMYMDTSFNKNLVLLPAEFRDPENWERTVLDYLGGMMDSYAISQYEKYYGKLSGIGLYGGRL